MTQPRCSSTAIAIGPGKASDEADPVGDVQPGVAPRSLHEADDVAGEAFALELLGGLEVEPDDPGLAGQRPAALGSRGRRRRLYSPSRRATPRLDGAVGDCGPVAPSRPR